MLLRGIQGLLVALLLMVFTANLPAETTPGTAKNDKIVIIVKDYELAQKLPGNEFRKDEQKKDAVDELVDLQGFRAQLRELWRETVQWFKDRQYDLWRFFIGLIVSLVGVWVIDIIFRRVILGLTRRTKTKFDDHIFEALHSPLALFVFCCGAFLSAYPLVAVNSRGIFMRIYFAALAGCGVWMVFRVIAVLDRYFKELASRSSGNLDNLLIDLVRKSIKIVVAIISVLFIGQNILGLNITALLAGAGVAGLAFAFAAKDSISNLFGSMMIILDKPFTIGDRIMVANIDGVVQEVGMRSTRIRALSGNLYSIPNNKLAEEVIENVTRRPSIKYEFELGLIYGTPPEQMARAMEILHEILDNHPLFSMTEFPPRIYFTAFKDFSLAISVIVWFQTNDYFTAQEAKNAINLEILRRFNAEGLEFAFPTNTTYLAGDQKNPVAINTGVTE